MLPVRYEHHLHIKRKAIPVAGRGDVFPARHQYNLHIKSTAISITGCVRPVGMFPVRYELHIKVKRK
jgi:hypothetical protein